VIDLIPDLPPLAWFCLAIIFLGWAGLVWLFFRG
jgi:hypothetical protein